MEKPFRRNSREDPLVGISWLELLERLQPVIVRIARRVSCQWGLRDDDQIEDLAQDIFVKLSQLSFSDANRPHDLEHLEHYVKAAAANAARDSLRFRFADKRGLRVTSELDANLVTLVASLGLRELDRQVLLRQVGELIVGSRRECAIFWLYYKQGFTSQEIAAIPYVGLGSKGVESLLNRMVVALRDRLTVSSRRGVPNA